MNNPIYLDYCANYPVKKEVLDDRCDRLSVINSIKSRRDTEDLLRNVVDEYGYILERELRKDK